MRATLRTRHAGLIGRVVEMAEVVRLLEPGRALTLTGVGGSGKTRIARRVIADSTARYPVGVWVVELADLSDPGLVANVIAGVLDLRIPADVQHSEVLAAFFSDHPGLLVLDNCEHLVEPVADLVADLLGQVAGLSVLATSQLPLGISRETVYQVPPLSTPEPGAVIELADAGRFESIALYVQRATEALATFRLTKDNVAGVAALVTRLDGIPLGIELAAARVRLLSADGLLARITDDLTVLESDLRDVPARQRSLAASVGWSYDLCSPPERELWNRLSVFVGGFELETVEAVCTGDGIEVAEVLGLLSTLVDLSVVHRVCATGSRFRMLETIRLFGAERLLESGGTARCRDRHLAWYADWGDRMDREWAGPDQLAWMDRLHAEHPNLRAALEHALGDPATTGIALRMCHTLQQLWICGGHLSEARRWIERAVATTAGSGAEKIRALRLCAWFGAVQMDLVYARARVSEAAGLLDEDADDLTRAYLLFADGAVSCWETDLEGGIALLNASEAAFRAAGDVTGTIQTQFITGLAHLFGGDFEAADAVQLACLETTDPLGETCVGAYARWSRGLSAQMAGDLSGAAALENDALVRSASLGDQMAMGLELETLAWIAAIEGNGKRAAVLLGAAGSIWRRISMPVERTPYVRDLHAMGEAQTRALLDGAAFEDAFRRGLVMALADVVNFALGGQLPRSASAANGPLSRRETEVAALVAEGMTNRDIAERLFLSERTVDGHVQSILRKLGFTSRTRIAVWFREQT